MFHEALATTFSMKRLVLTLLLVRLCASIERESRVLYLTFFFVDTRTAPGVDVDTVVSHDPAAASTPRQYVLHVTQASEMVRQRLQADLGISVGTYLPSNTYLVLATLPQRRRTRTCCGWAYGRHSTVCCRNWTRRCRTTGTVRCTSS